MNEIVIIKEEDIRDKIYTIRGLKVMIDSDLAKIYGYTTKSFNRQIKNNIDRFDEEFRFQLSREEYYRILRSKSLTLGLEQGKYSKYMPYAFTEEGIYMLMTVLKGEKAIKQSKALIKIFKSMKDFIIDNNLVDQRFINDLVLKQESVLLKHDIRLSKVETDLKDIKKIHRVFLEGDVYDAYSFILDIFNNSDSELVIIDNYVNKEILDIVSKLNISVKIVSKNMDEELFKKYTKQYDNVTFVRNDSFHDRFIVVDNKIVFNIGSSIKDLGKKICCVNKITDDKEINKIVNEINKKDD